MSVPPLVGSGWTAEVCLVHRWLLADVFLQEVRRTLPHFATLFVNAAAHIQHHYLFNSSVYNGKSRNPDWYVASGKDPVLEVYELYDRIVARTISACPDARVMLGTGLHQNVHAEVTYYWRLKDHAAFLRAAGVVFEAVQPRMSRDFLVACGSPTAASAAAARLGEIHAADGKPLFTVDNRGADLFVELTYSHDVPPGQAFRAGDREIPDLRSSLAFVALKNGEHDGIGYFVDTGRRLDPGAAPFPLASIPGMIFDALLGDGSSDAGCTPHFGDIRPLSPGAVDPV